MQYVVSLAEHRHFRRAAEAMGVSQPSLTKALQRIERELGAKLFDRSRARVTTTPLGEEVIRRGRRLLAEATELQRTVDVLRAGDSGKITVGVGPAMSDSFVTDAIAEVAHRHPRASMTVRVDHWQQLSRGLLAGELDFYVADLDGAVDDRQFACTRFPPQPFVWFCRASHPLARQKRVTQADLVRFPVVTPRLPPWAQQWFDQVAPDGDPPRRFPTVECENYAMLKRCVLSGDAVSAALRNSLSKEVDEGRLVILPIHVPELATDAGIVRRRDRTLAPLAMELIACIEEHARSVSAG